MHLIGPPLSDLVKLLQDTPHIPRMYIRKGQTVLALMNTNTPSDFASITELLPPSLSCCGAGFAGADLQALCTGAVMAAVRRSAPEILADPCLEHGIPLQPPSAAAAYSHPFRSSQRQESTGQPEGTAALPEEATEPLSSAAKHALRGHHGLPASSIPCPDPAAAHSLEEGPAQQLPTQPAQQASSLTDGQNSAYKIAATGRNAAPPAMKALPQIPGLQLGDNVQPGAQSEPELSAVAASAPGAVEVRWEAVAIARAASASSALGAVEVRACDWRQALALAPEACARRDSMAALSAAAVRALPARLGPALLPACALVLQVFTWPRT